MAKKRLLVVDDEEGFLELVKDYFVSKGYEVSTAMNVDEALKLYRKFVPKVVLLDFNLPVVSGEKILPMFQSVNPSVRVIVVTGCIGEEVEERFKGLGYFAYFEKSGLSLERVHEKVEEAYRY